MLIILDRDGVINQYEGDYICSVAQWHPLPGSIEAIGRLCRAGHRVAVATNQSGIGRGLYDRAALAAMHERLNRLVSRAGGCIDYIAYCPHHPDDGCACRKPLPGLIHEIRDALGLQNLSGCIMVGDSRKDLEAGLAAGCKPYLVRTGNGRDTEYHLQNRPLSQVSVFDDLQSFTDHLVMADAS